VGIKSRLGWRVDVCFRGDCVHHNTPACKNCLRFDLYEEARKDTSELQQMPKQDLPDNRKAMSGDGEVST